MCSCGFTLPPLHLSPHDPGPLRLESSAEDGGCDDLREVTSKLIMIVVMEARLGSDDRKPTR